MNHVKSKINFLIIDILLKNNENFILFNVEKSY